MHALNRYRIAECYNMTPESLKEDFILREIDKKQTERKMLEASLPRPPGRAGRQ